MLERVEIQNFALIEQAVFEPGKHFTVISGETGAGKSLLIDALGSLTGKRARKEMVRKGEAFARVEAIFSFAQNEYIPPSVTEYIEDQQLILNREIQADGGSRARVNGRLISISLLREITENLIGLHAQNEQLVIFETDEQRNLLDKYAGNTLQELLITWQALLQQRKSFIKKIKEYGLTPAERNRRLELLRYEISEIEEADLKEDEETYLMERNKILASLNRIKQDISESVAFLSADTENSAGKLLALSTQKLEYASRQSRTVLDMMNRLKEISYQTSLLNVELQDFYQKLTFNPQEIEEIQTRLDLIHKLKMKYGDTIPEILAYCQKQKDNLQMLLDSEENFLLYRQKLLDNEAEMNELANQITKLRQQAGMTIAKEIRQALAQLAMPDIIFQVKVSQISKHEKGYYGKSGRDFIEFYIQTNVGEDLLPLRKIASGGETSRILLAIKSIFSKTDHLSVMIFDEIDTGISGQTAIKMADMLVELGQDKQVLCVSHMPQLAVAADCHFFISKQKAENRTVTKIEKLTPAQRIAEIARLLSGNQQDEKSILLAKQMLKEYKNFV